MLCAVAVACAAQSALASCGDYLAHPSGQMLGPDHDFHAPMTPAVPCRGPHCRQAPAKQPLPAPQRIVLTPERDAVCWRDSDRVSMSDVSWVVQSDDPRLDSFFGFRLFRPPRVV